MDQHVSWQIALWSLSLAFVLGTVVAWVYELTYQGLSYSRTFVHSLALGGLLSALVMLAIGNDIARGLGLMGALSVVRFRASLKEPRDLLFMFASLGVGVACGVQSYPVAAIGTAVFCVAAVYTSWSSFGSRLQFDAVLRLVLPVNPALGERLEKLLEQHCANHALLNLRDLGGGSQEHAYQLKLTDPKERATLLAEVGKLEGASGITFLAQDRTVEV
jgi:uncharacterized membrane protein YhiD involved in acid resistance